MRYFKKLIFLIVLGALAFSVYFFLSPKKTSVPQAENTSVPAAKQSEKTPETQEAVISPNETEKSLPADPIPEKFLLDVPFYSQAPLSKWDAFHEEMCEEASILNAGLYLENKKLTKDQFEMELHKIQKIEKDEIGEWKSTTVSQTKKWADVYFGGNLSIKIIDNPTIDDIETEVSDGHPVVVPLAGRDIGNPNFTPPGPVYHMLVIKGYDAQNFITNDVGTRKGSSYIYKKEVIMENIHDWNAKDIHLGAKKVLALMKNS